LGSRVHETHFYKPGSYPFGLIAPVTIIWKSLNVSKPPEKVPGVEDTSPSDSQPKATKRRRGKGKEKEVAVEPATKPGPDTQRTLWIRVHPSAWQDVWDVVQGSASFVLDGLRQEKTSHVNTDEIVNKESVGTSEDPKAEESIDLMDLRSQVNCFELMGPLSSQVIRGAMTLANGDDRTMLRDVSILHELESLLTSMTICGSVLGTTERSTVTRICT
jgi:ribonuclease P/MRP protein subunit POP1